ncbi:hypothetical protein TSUD_281730 [Trifolium subterraneum]|uniref:Uncharacterized protein n=1 Tax=Trifolium subterraneum TaxID=3900 RepID=A0A2Z6LYB7_TRISU|nr:hypothetical protein TSUD_281730 [Trifolium subterraneum]
MLFLDRVMIPPSLGGTVGCGGGDGDTVIGCGSGDGEECVDGEETSWLGSG